MMDDCAEKNCDTAATLGMTWTINGVRLEFYVCEAHFDAIGPAMSTDTRPQMSP